MKNSKRIIIAVVFIALVVLYFVLSTSSCGAKPSDAQPEETVVTTAPANVEDSQGGSDAAQPASAGTQSGSSGAQSASAPSGSGSDSTNTAASSGEETVEAPVILENEGSLEIVLPEGMASDGF